MPNGGPKSHIILPSHCWTVMTVKSSMERGLKGSWVKACLGVSHLFNTHGKEEMWWNEILKEKDFRLKHFGLYKRRKFKNDDVISQCNKWKMLKHFLTTKYIDYETKSIFQWKQIYGVLGRNVEILGCLQVQNWGTCHIFISQNCSYSVSPRTALCSHPEFSSSSKTVYFLSV